MPTVELDPGIRYLTATAESGGFVAKLNTDALRAYPKNPFKMTKHLYSSAFICIHLRSSVFICGSKSHRTYFSDRFLETDDLTRQWSLLHPLQS